MANRTEPRPAPRWSSLFKRCREIVMAFKLRDREYVERVNKQGIFYAARNADLDFFIADKEYYRNTVHSDAYIADHWSRFFTSVQVAERTFGFQDCVICIK